MDGLDLFFDHFEVVHKTERHRPHWRQDGKLYFVTWRQWDSIPLEKREQLKRDREAWVSRFGDIPYYKLSYADLRRYHALFSERVGLLCHIWESCACVGSSIAGFRAFGYHAQLEVLYCEGDQ